MPRPINTVSHPSMPEVLAGDPLPSGADRFSWYDRASRFRMTLRREQIKGRKAAYWYAYVKANGKTHKAYVGREEALTSPRLFEVALALKEKAGLFRR
ncbi:MAG: hypothetical protein R3247_06890 [Rhodothermales bacterium]|nr:hypothetical protein [Rhodothermales bacterium]